MFFVLLMMILPSTKSNPVAALSPGLTCITNRDLPCILRRAVWQCQRFLCPADRASSGGAATRAGGWLFGFGPARAWWPAQQAQEGRTRVCNVGRGLGIPLWRAYGVGVI